MIHSIQMQNEFLGNEWDKQIWNSTKTKNHAKLPCRHRWKTGCEETAERSYRRRTQIQWLRPESKLNPKLEKKKLSIVNLAQNMCTWRNGEKERYRKQTRAREQRSKKMTRKFKLWKSISEREREGLICGSEKWEEEGAE